MKTEIPPFLFFYVLSLILMIVSNLSFKGKDNDDAADFVFPFLACTAAALAIPTVADTAALFPLIVASFVAIVAALTRNNKIYKVLSAIYYVAMLIAIVILFA